MCSMLMVSIWRSKGYNVPKPLEPTSNFAKLYALAKEHADMHTSAPVPMHPLGSRTMAEHAHFQVLLSRRGHNVVEPSFIPEGPWTPPLQIESAALPGHCLSSDRPKGIGDTTSLLLRKCTSGGEMSHWIWNGVQHDADSTTAKITNNNGHNDNSQQNQQNNHEVAAAPDNVRVDGSEISMRRINGQQGYLRPGLQRNMGGGMWGRIMCLTGLSWKKYKSREDRIPLTMVCNPARWSQVWEIPPVLGVAGSIVNPNRTLCLETNVGPPLDVTLEECDPDKKSQAWTTSLATVGM